MKIRKVKGESKLTPGKAGAKFYYALFSESGFDGRLTAETQDADSLQLSTVVDCGFMRGNIWEYMESHMLSEDFHCLSEPKDLFAMVRVEEIYKLTAGLPVIREKLIATDGASVYLRDLIDAMDEKSFELWMRYHLATCERQELIGATSHSLDILKKYD